MSENDTLFENLNYPEIIKKGRGRPRKEPLEEKPKGKRGRKKLDTREKEVLVATIALEKERRAKIRERLDEILPQETILIRDSIVAEMNAIKKYLMILKIGEKYAKMQTYDILAGLLGCSVSQVRRYIDDKIIINKLEIRYQELALEREIIARDILIQGTAKMAEDVVVDLNNTKINYENISDRDKVALKLKTIDTVKGI